MNPRRPTNRRRPSAIRAGWVLLGLAVACVHGPAGADEEPAGLSSSAAESPAPDAKSAKDVGLNYEAPETEVDMKTTDLGIRFTPGMARAFAKQMARGMSREYELDDDQTAAAQEIFAKNLMKLAHDTQKHGRDAMELMIENMVSNDGAFTKADGQKWAGLMREIMPDIKKFIANSASQVGKKMTLSQRLKLTTQMTAFSAGVALFEERLKRWEGGDLPELGNPFEDKEDEEARSADGKGDARSAEVRRAERRAERSIGWETDVDSRWTDYVEGSIKFYEMTETQATSARSILTESLSRAKQIRTADWQARIKKNRTTANMSWRLPGQLGSGPWMWHLDQEYEELLRPLQDLGKELRSRVDGLVETPQREKAMSRVRDELSRQGFEPPPA